MLIGGNLHEHSWSLKSKCHLKCIILVSLYYCNYKVLFIYNNYDDIKMNINLIIFTCKQECIYRTSLHKLPVKPSKWETISAAWPNWTHGIMRHSGVWMFVISSEQKEITEISAWIQQPHSCKLSVPGTLTDGLEKKWRKKYGIITIRHMWSGNYWSGEEMCKQRWHKRARLHVLKDTQWEEFKYFAVN